MSVVRSNVRRPRPARHRARRSRREARRIDRETLAGSAANLAGSTAGIPVRNTFRAVHAWQSRGFDETCTRRRSARANRITGRNADAPPARIADRLALTRSDGADVHASIAVAMATATRAASPSTIAIADGTGPGRRAAIATAGSSTTVAEATVRRTSSRTRGISTSGRLQRLRMSSWVSRRTPRYHDQRQSNTSSIPVIATPAAMATTTVRWSLASGAISGRTPLDGEAEESAQRLTQRVWR